MKVTSYAYYNEQMKINECVPLRIFLLRKTGVSPEIGVLYRFFFFFFK